MKTKTFTQQIQFNTTPQQLYDIIMLEKLHAEVMQADAKISNKVGGKFDIWDGYITGKNVELIIGKKIVQEWHALEMPLGHISLVTFEFIPQKSNTTLLKFTHANVPVDVSANYEKGWVENYWEPIKAWLKDYK
ncbi:MAG: SRPBCC domain-containing protein [Chitinophagales bacterium]